MPPRNTVAPFYDSLAWRERYNPLPDLTPERTVELYCAWREGRYADVMFVFDALEEWDDTLGTLVDRRLSALGELDHGISINSDAVGDDPALQALADDQQQTMSDIMSRVSNMSEVIEHLGLATFRGFSHLEEVIDGDEIRLEPVDQWFWNRPMKRGPWFYNPTAVNSLSDLHPVSDGELIIRRCLVRLTLWPCSQSPSRRTRKPAGMVLLTCLAIRPCSLNIRPEPVTKRRRNTMKSCSSCWAMAGAVILPAVRSYQWKRRPQAA